MFEQIIIACIVVVAAMYLGVVWRRAYRAFKQKQASCSGCPVVKARKSDPLTHE